MVVGPRPGDHDPAPADRYDRAEALLDAEARRSPASSGRLENLCRCLTELMDLEGAVIRLIPEAGDAGLLVAAEAGSEMLGELEIACGEGPGLTAFHTHRPVFATHLSGPGGERWPGFRSAAGAAGIGAVYAVPLAVGAVRLGTLEAFTAAESPLSREDVSLLLVFADIALEHLLDRLTSPDAGPPREVLRAVDHRAEIAQAQGMTMVDLGVSLTEALLRLRAHAFSEEVTLLELSRRIIRGYRLPSEPDPEQP